MNIQSGEYPAELFGKISKIIEDTDNTLSQNEENMNNKADYSYVDSELLQNKNLIGWELQNKIRKTTPLVTIIDDDGRIEVLTKLLPLSQTYDIPMVSAVISERVVSTDSYLDFMKQSDLIMLQNIGWEISSHTQTHRRLTDLTYSEQETELKVSKETLNQLGLKVSTLCYPYGVRNDDTVEIARKYYRCGRRTDSTGKINLTPLETFDITTMPLGSYFDTWVSPPFPTDSLDYYKWSVDQAVASNGWLIIMTHCGDPQHTETQQEYLEEVIQYIKSLNIDIVTLDEGLNKRGNIVDIGRYYTGNTVYRKHLVIGCDGTYAGSELQNSVIVTSFIVNNETPPKAFVGRKLYHTRIDNTNNTDFPSTIGGILITDTTGKILPLEGYAHQIYKIRNTNEIYRRYEVDENTWTPWQVFNPVIVLPSNSVALSTNGKTGFTKNNITKCVITTNLTGAPEVKSGLLTTDRTSNHDYYIYQTYEVTDSANLYRRYWLQATSTWGAWMRITSLALTTTERNAGQLIRNIGDMVFDITLGKPVWYKTAPNIWVDATGTQV
jgi:peptidoglycan/xylan/chitin deacetylase (PgdA/CDA1 family)